MLASFSGSVTDSGGRTVEVQPQEQIVEPIECWVDGGVQRSGRAARIRKREQAVPALRGSCPPAAGAAPRSAGVGIGEPARRAGAATATATRAARPAPYQQGWNLSPLSATQSGRP